MNRSGSLLICGLLLVAPAARAGDLTIRQRTTTNAAGQTSTREEMQYAHGDLLVIDAADTRTIVDVAAKTMTVADKAKKTYFVMTFDDMRKQAEAVRSRVAKMPADVRKMLEEMLGSGGAVTLKPTGKHEKIAGFDASEQELSGGPFHGSIWTTDAIELARRRPPVARARRGARRRRADRRGRSREALARVHGLPLRSAMTATVGPGSFTTTIEVLEASTKAAAARGARAAAGLHERSPRRRTRAQSGSSSLASARARSASPVATVVSSSPPRRRSRAEARRRRRAAPRARTTSRPSGTPWRRRRGATPAARQQPVDAVRAIASTSRRDPALERRRARPCGASSIGAVREAELRRVRRRQRVLRRARPRRAARSRGRPRPGARSAAIFSGSSASCASRRSSSLVSRDLRNDSCSQRSTRS